MAKTPESIRVEGMVKNLKDVIETFQEFAAIVGPSQEDAARNVCSQLNTVLHSARKLIVLVEAPS